MWRAVCLFYLWLPFPPLFHSDPKFQIVLNMWKICAEHWPYRALKGTHMLTLLTHINLHSTKSLINTICILSCPDHRLLVSCPVSYLRLIKRCRECKVAKGVGERGNNVETTNTHTHIRCKVLTFESTHTDQRMPCQSQQAFIYISDLRAGDIRQSTHINNAYFSVYLNLHMAFWLESTQCSRRRPAVRRPENTFYIVSNCLLP